jgi:hypothetical protein
MNLYPQVPIEQQMAAQRTGNPTPFPWDQVAGQFGVEPGLVTIEDFDLGVVRTLGAYVDPRGPLEEASFILPVKGLKEDAQRLDGMEDAVVPVTFANSEAYMNIWKLPGVFIHRDAIEPDMTRYSQELEGFRIPAPNTKLVDGSVASVDPLGPAEVMSRVRAEAYNITYTIDMIARYRTDANALLRTILPRYKQQKAVIVQDSKGDFNEYTAFLESIDQLDEVLGVTLKHHGWSLTIRVIAELDLAENDIRPTATSIQPIVIPKKPGDLAPSLTASDGLPLKTQKANVLGTICSMVPRMK